MKVGVHFNYQNYSDWDRFEAQAVSEQPQVSDQQVYEEEIHLGGLVEPLGFDSYWCIDHHFSPYIMTSGAMQNLTYFAGKTERIDFGTMVIVLPWYDPVAITEQITVLDNMLQGRKLTLGLGRGAAKREFEGVPLADGRIPRPLHGVARSRPQGPDPGVLLPRGRLLHHSRDHDPSTSS